jgi:hypothetical protein
MKKKNVQGKASKAIGSLLALVFLSLCYLWMTPVPVRSDESDAGGLSVHKTSTETSTSLTPDRIFGPNKNISKGREWTTDKKNKFWKQQVFTHTFSSGSHSIAVYGGDVYVVWYDTRRGSADVYFSRSTDGGENFSQSIRVNDDEVRTIHYKPSLGVDAKGHIYVAWRDDRNGHADIFFAKSIDGGKTFLKNIKLNDDPGWAYQGNPALAVGPDGLVGVAWNENRDKNDDVYFTLSHDGGINFSKNRKANDDKGSAVQSHPSIAIGPDGLIAIAWQDFRNGDSDIYMIMSKDGGKTFSSNQKLNDDPGTAPQVSPSVSINGETVLVAWADYRNGPMLISPPDSARAEPEWWERVRKGDPDIYYTVSRDGGDHFSQNAKVNDDDGMNAQAFPSTAVDGQGRLFVAWEDYRNENSDIFFSQISQSESDELRYHSNIKVNDDTGTMGQYHPSLATTPSGRTFLIWTDVRHTQRLSGLEEEDYEEKFKKRKMFMSTPEEVYFAIGKTEGVRLSQHLSP